MSYPFKITTNVSADVHKALTDICNLSQMSHAEAVRVGVEYWLMNEAPIPDEQRDVIRLRTEAMEVLAVHGAINMALAAYEQSRDMALLGQIMVVCNKHGIDVPVRVKEALNES